MVKSSIFTLCAIRFFDTIGFGLILPVLPFYAKTFAAEPTHITQLVAIHAVAGMIANPIFGWMSDRTCRKRIIIFSLVCTSFAYIGLMVAESLFTVFVFRALTGALSAKGGVTAAFMVDLVPKQERTNYLSKLHTMNAAGLLFRPIFGSSLYSVHAFELSGFDSVFIGTIALTVGTLIVASLALPPSSREKHTNGEIPTPRSAQSSRIKNAGKQLFLNWSLFVSFSSILSTTAIFVDARFGLGASDVGIIIGIMAGIVAVVQAFFVSKIIHSLGEVRSLKMSFLLFSAALAIMGTTQLFPVFFFFYCFGASVYALAAMAIIASLSHQTPNAEQGTVMGMLESSASFGIVCGSFFYGYAFKQISVGAPFVIGSLILLGVMAILNFGNQTGFRKVKSESE